MSQIVICAYTVTQHLFDEMLNSFIASSNFIH